MEVLNPYRRSKALFPSRFRNLNKLVHPKTYLGPFKRSRLIWQFLQQKRGVSQRLKGRIWVHLSWRVIQLVQRNHSWESWDLIPKNMLKDWRNIIWQNNARKCLRLTITNRKIKCKFKLETWETMTMIVDWLCMESVRVLGFQSYLKAPQHQTIKQKPLRKGLKRLKANCLGKTNFINLKTIKWKDQNQKLKLLIPISMIVMQRMISQS